MSGQSEEFFGYRKPYIPGSAGVANTYAQANSTIPYQGTDWGSTDVDSLWEMVRRESDERVFALAAMWRRASTLLDATRQNLQRHAEALQSKWTSPAGTVFMQKVGASLYSLDEWKQAADDNASGLEQLGAKIGQVQREMKAYYESYQAEQDKQAKKREDENWVGWVNPFGENPKSVEDVRNEAKEGAVALVKPLAEMYMDVYFTKLGRGSVYQGPTNAAFRHEDAPAIPARPGSPGAAPGAPGVGGGGLPRPGTPGTGDAPATPTPPPANPGIDTPPAPPAPPGPPPAAAPEGIDLAGGGAPAPAPPTAPAPTPPGVAPGPAPAPPTAPGIPTNLGGRPTLPPAGPAGRPTPPNKASLPGTGRPAPAPRGPAPGKPTLPGTRGSGGAPSGPGAPGNARRAPAPGSPRLPGSTGPATGRPAAPRAGAPGTGRAPQAPSLGGNRGTPPARPATGPTGSKPASPQLGGRGNPGSPGSTGTPRAGRPGAPAPRPGVTKPDLIGRGTAPGAKAPAQGPRPALGGRQVQPGIPTPRSNGRKNENEVAEWTYDGDDELWATDSEAVSSIETPAEHRPQSQGRSLGQG